MSFADKPVTILISLNAVFKFSACLTASPKAPETL
jgi:hypothetical protein